MRPKFFSAVVLLGLVLLVCLYYVRPHGSSATRNSALPGSVQQQTTAKAAAPIVPAAALAKTPAPAAPQPAAAVADPNAMSPEQKHQQYVDARVAELMDLSMKDDKVSLDTITSELTNRDPQIRKAALEATVQFASRDAIPKLMDAASQTDDPNEKAQIVEAIEFLKLPSLTEVMAQGGTHPAAPKAAAVRVPASPRPKPW